MLLRVFVVAHHMRKRREVFMRTLATQHLLFSCRWPSWVLAWAMLVSIRCIPVSHPLKAIAHQVMKPQWRRFISTDWVQSTTTSQHLFLLSKRGMTLPLDDLSRLRRKRLPIAVDAIAGGELPLRLGGQIERQARELAKPQTVVLGLLPGHPGGHIIAGASVLPDASTTTPRLTVVVLPALSVTLAMITYIPGAR